MTNNEPDVNQKLATEQRPFVFVYVKSRLAEAKHGTGAEEKENSLKILKQEPKSNLVRFPAPEINVPFRRNDDRCFVIDKKD